MTDYVVVIFDGPVLVVQAESITAAAEQVSRDYADDEILEVRRRDYRDEDS